MCVSITFLRYNVFDNGKPEESTLQTSKKEATVINLDPFTDYKFFIKRENDILYPKFPTVEAKTLEARKYLWLSVALGYVLACVRVQKFGHFAPYNNTFNV